jgi:hypothetical protein
VDSATARIAAPPLAGSDAATPRRNPGALDEYLEFAVKPNILENWFEEVERERATIEDEW